MDAEAELDRIEAGYYESDEAFAVLAPVLEEVNNKLTRAGDKERIRKLVERLHDAVRWIADHSEDVDGYSISVGFPAGVSVTLNWKKV